MPEEAADELNPERWSKPVSHQPEAFEDDEIPSSYTGGALTSDDGRPLVCLDKVPSEASLWLPNPPREGDPAYCCGQRVGTFHGDGSKPGEWYIDIVPTKDMPPDIAAHFRERYNEYEKIPPTPDTLHCGRCGAELRSTLEGQPPHTHRLACTGCGKIHAIRLRLGADGRGVTDGASVELGGLEALCYPPSVEALRDHFAEVALGKIIESGPLPTLTPSPVQTWPDEAARLAYQFADAMLRARAIPPTDLADRKFRSRIGE